MESYIARESLAEARRDRSRQVLLPAAVVLWALGALLLFAAAAGLVSVVLGAVSDAPLHLTIATSTQLPVNAAAPDQRGGPFVPDSSAPVMTGVELSVRGASPLTAFAVRLAPTIETAAGGAVCLLAGLVVVRLDRRRACSRLLLRATVVLAAGSIAAQLLAFAGAAGIGAVAWTGIPQIAALVDRSTAAFDPTPFAVAFGLLVVVHLLRRLEGSGVLVAPDARSSGVPRR